MTEFVSIPYTRSAWRAGTEGFTSVPSNATETCGGKNAAELWWTAYFKGMGVYSVLYLTRNNINNKRIYVEDRLRNMFWTG